MSSWKSSWVANYSLLQENEGQKMDFCWKTKPIFVAGASAVVDVVNAIAVVVAVVNGIAVPFVVVNVVAIGAVYAVAIVDVNFVVVNVNVVVAAVVNVVAIGAAVYAVVIVVVAAIVTIRAVVAVAIVVVAVVFVAVVVVVVSPSLCWNIFKEDFFQLIAFWDGKCTLSRFDASHSLSSLYLSLSLSLVASSLYIK